MASHAHVVLTDYGPSFGWGVTSPQLPELVGGYKTRRDLEDALPCLLTFGGLELEGRAERHVQRYVPAGDDEVAIRVAQDALRNERIEAAAMLEEALSRGIGLSADDVATRSGEVVIVACVANDTLRWVLEQGGDQPIGIAYREGNTLRLYFAQNSGRNAGLGPSLLELGETVDSTVAQVCSHLGDVPQNQPVRALARV